MEKLFRFSMVGLLVLVSSFMFAAFASAHGYVESSRAELCKREVNKDCGNVQYEPQSVEAIGGFPLTGPVDGKIAGAGAFPELDVQTTTRWSKVSVSPGMLPIKWKFTANHATEYWRYYITKPEWNPNEPLKRSDLQLITTIDGGFKRPDMETTHLVNIPADRSGYHLILAVWEIGDTVNAFYQVMDINIVNPNAKDTVAPTVPTKVAVGTVTDSTVSLTWTPSTDNVGVKQYDVYRDGVKVGTTARAEFSDQTVKQATTYRYAVKAIDAAGNESAASEIVAVTTKAANAPDTEAPTVPLDVHVMAPTETTANVHWTAAKDNVGVEKYEIYVDGQLLRTSLEPTVTLLNLAPKTTYRVKVRAIDAAKNASAFSGEVTFTTLADSKAPSTVTGVVANNVSATSFDVSWAATTDNVAIDRYEVYCNDQLFVKTTATKATVTNLTSGKDYVVTIFALDAAGNRSTASAAVTVRTGGQAANAWSATAIYVGGQRVTYNGAVYEAKWWTQGETPGKADVWKLIP